MTFLCEESFRTEKDSKKHNAKKDPGVDFRTGKILQASKTFETFGTFELAKLRLPSFGRRRHNSSAHLQEGLQHCPCQRSSLLRVSSSGSLRRKDSWWSNV